MTYPEFFRNFRYGKTKNRPSYIDLKGRYLTQRGSGKEALIRTREIKVTKSEDAFMHLLMLHHPWRNDVDTWIGHGTGYDSYQSMAADERYLGREKIKELADGLLVVLDHGDVYGNPASKNILDVPGDMQWTDDQKKVFEVVQDGCLSPDGCRILVTGAAGTGKSAVLKELCRIAKNKRFEPIRLAPSGVAAVNINGQTLHRWFRITKMSGRQGFPNCNSYAIREQLMAIKDQGLKPMFLIDEVSMISGTMLTALSNALQEAGDVDSGVAFGGYPVIMFGDFGQLGPINKAVETTDWVWKSDVYRSFQRMDLLQACRQSGDPGFKLMLDHIRRGELSAAMVSVFLQIYDASKPVPGDAVHLYPKKEDVDKLNKMRLRSLLGEEWHNIATDNAGVTKNKAKRAAIEAETGLLSLLRLKIGARVMCTSNVDVAGGLVNGTTGVVTAIYDKHVVQIRTDTGLTFNVQQECRLTRSDGQERRQFPLVLAWAMTIHKSQSLTLSKVAVSLSKVFASGQAYVALSRVRARHELFIENFSVRGLINVKHAIRTRLTKELEDARTAEDDEKDKEEDDPNIVGRQDERVQGHRHFSISASENEDCQQEESGHGSLWTDSISSCESETELWSKRLRESSSLSTDPSEDDEPDTYSSSDDERPPIAELSADSTAQAEESVVNRPPHGEGLSTFRSEKRKHYASSDSDSNELRVTIGGARLYVSSGQGRARMPSLGRSRKRVRDGPSSSDDESDNDGGNRLEMETSFGTVSVKRKADDDIGTSGPMKKLREDEKVVCFSQERGGETIDRLPVLKRRQNRCSECGEMGHNRSRHKLKNKK